MKNLIYNTVKQKLLDGKKVVGGTINTPDPDIYLEMANSGFDFLWIEMQHNPMTYQEAARLIRAGKDTPAIPFIRIPDATEGDLQKAVDIGALGIVVPMVNSVEKVRKAIKFASYPPIGERSQGYGQCNQIWRKDYRDSANDNIMFVAQIESPTGVDIVEELTQIDGLDIIMVASTDLSSFSGFKQGDEKYESMVTKVHDATLSNGLKLGGPYAWKERKGFSFFQGPDAASILRCGVKNILEETTDGIAETKGNEK